MGSPHAVLVARYLRDGRVHVGRRVGAGFARLTGYPWEGGAPTGEHDPDEAVTLLAPVVPTKVVCVGLNYRAHIAESVTAVPGGEPPAEPLLFLKPPSAVVGPGAAIVRPPRVTRLDPEGEMAVVIGRRARRVPAAAALDHVAGVTCLNDVSARNFQRSDGQWTRAKGFDTFAPLGPWVAAGLDPSDLAIECRVNGARRQAARTSDLLFGVPVLVAHVSSIMTLEPGDVIATGTPAGVAPIVPGDRVEVEVEGVGVLVNTVEATTDAG
jgi:2-keto-4-pentenoate hydratase/2-oxohepta-3-ene-1,7-dioic acid hydratase in catechol pathway